MIFQKKDYVYAETLGVCRVEEVTNLTQKNGEVMQYYGLRSQENKATTAYYPVEHHEVELRELISLEEANRILEENDEELDKHLLFEAKFVIAKAKLKKGKP